YQRDRAIRECPVHDSLLRGLPRSASAHPNSLATARRVGHGHAHVCERGHTRMLFLSGLTADHRTTRKKICRSCELAHSAAGGPRAIPMRTSLAYSVGEALTQIQEQRS